MSGRRFNNLYGLVSWLPGFSSNSPDFREPDGSRFDEVPLISDMTRTKMRVNQDSTISLPAVWAALRNVSEDVATLGLFLKERVSADTLRIVSGDEHYLAKLYENPNPYMSSFDFRQCVVMQMMMEKHTGEIIRDESGQPIQIIPVYVKESKIIDGALVHHVLKDNGQTKVVFDDDMIVCKGLTYDGVNALNAVSKLKESISLSQALITYAATFFGNGVHPSMILGFDPGMKEEQVKKTKNRIVENQTGALNQHKVLALKGLVKAQQWTVNAEDAQLLTSMRFAIEDVARIWRVPPHKLMELSRSTNNNIEHQSKEYLTDSILPKTIRLQEEYDRKLLTEAGRRKYKTEHDHSVLLQTDSKTQVEVLKELFNMSAISPNEIRKKLNMNPREGGDVYFIPQNVAMVDTDGNILPVNKTEADMPAPSPIASMTPFAEAMFTRIETRAWRTKNWNDQSFLGWLKSELEPFSQYCDIDEKSIEIMETQKDLLASEIKETHKRAELFIKELENVDSK